MDVLCFFHVGDPPVGSVHRLVTANDDVMEPTEQVDASQIRHFIPSVKCEDSGLVRCVMLNYNTVTVVNRCCMLLINALMTIIAQQ